MALPKAEKSRWERAMAKTLETDGSRQAKINRREVPPGDT